MSRIHQSSHPAPKHPPSPSVNGTTSITQATVEAHCRSLRLPTVAAQFERLAQEAVREHQPHASYLATLLGAEVDERERHTVQRRIHEARLPRFKTLEEFD